ncbi:hypothetical protein ACFLTK_03370 [Chloroflexota bacterium]
MRIMVWLRQKRLGRRKNGHTRRLSEIRTSLQKLKPREPKMRLVIQSEMMRIRELRKELNKVKSEEELRFWYSLFSMCVPSFKALIGTSQARTTMRRLKGGGR